MTQVTTRFKGQGKALTKFNPQQTRPKLGALSEAIKHARKIKNWDALEQALDMVIDEQCAFVAWWDLNVTPGRESKLELSSKRAGKVVAKTRQPIDADAAAEATGIDKKRVSRWRKGLADETTYRAKLREPMRDLVWYGKIQRNARESEAKRSAALARVSQAEFNAAKLGKYVVIYADPPWQYEHPPIGASNRSIENHYPTMTLDEIKAMPIADIAHDDSVLFLWATSPKLVECMEVITAWGFTYRTSAVWVKDKIGMGYYFRERHELILVAKRGELPPPPPDLRHDSVINYPRGDHSEKPESVAQMLDVMYPGVTRKIELFARKPRSGWKVWGNEAT